MAGFWKIALLILTVLYPTIGHMLFHTEDKLADCLLASIGRLTNNTIHIRIEVEDATIRKSFEDTVSRFLAKNDAVLVDLDAKESCNNFIRLYFVESLKSFKNFIDQQRSRECDRSSGKQYYFVVLPNSVLLEEILNFCWKAYILNVNVLVEDKKEIVTLYTYYPFTKSKCRDSTPTIYNRFINGSFEWNKELFPQKMNNLWQCPIRAIVWASAPHVWVQNNQVFGLNGEILKTLSSIMNSSIELVISSEGKGIFYPNNSASGAFKMLKDGLGDISLGAAGSMAERRTFFASTVALYRGHVYALVKRPKLYRSLDVLLLPFDWIMWLSLSTLLLAKWICLLLWKKWSNRFPYCSTRLHTMAWLYAMFIVRSSYEGSIFRFLQDRPIAWVPQNIDEAIDNGYKFLAQPRYYRRLHENPQLKDHLMLYNDSLFKSLTMLDTYKEKYAVLSSNLSLLINEDYILIPTPLFMISYWMEMEKYSFLTEAINARIEWLLANGYIQRNYVKHIQMPNLLKKGKHNERRSISLQHIKGAFIFFAICIAVNIFVFVAELFAERHPLLKKLLNNV